MDYALGQEKKEVAAKSLEALEKMGHKGLKLNEHESPSLPVRLDSVGNAHPPPCSCHRLGDYPPG